MRIVAAIVSALALVGVTANGAWAFYNSKSCTTYGNTLNVTNYSKGSGQEYHWSLKTNTYSWQTYQVVASGVTIADGSSLKEGYKYYSNPTASYTIRAKWVDNGGEGGVVTCYVYF